MKRIVAGSQRRLRWLAAFALLAAHTVAGCDLTPQPLPPVPTESVAAASGNASTVAEDAATPLTTGGSAVSDATVEAADANAADASGTASSAGGSSSLGDGGPDAEAASDAANPDAASDGATDAMSDADSDVDATW
ncbi:MAG TPA: hypothetical protein VEK07_20810 [Polyangiaceae bacterium]|nr:hypothetical protein [Polyangiaceae bacterium]